MLFAGAPGLTGDAVSWLLAVIGLIGGPVAIVYGWRNRKTIWKFIAKKDDLLASADDATAIITRSFDELRKKSDDSKALAESLAAEVAELRREVDALRAERTVAEVLSKALTDWHDHAHAAAAALS